jgi:hypothetical protein
VFPESGSLTAKERAELEDRLQCRQQQVVHAGSNPRITPVYNWSAIHVPSLPRAAIERLRTADLSSLAAITELRPHNGRLVASCIDAATTIAGVEWTGKRLLVGLTAREIDELRMRIDDLLRRVDRDELALY